MGLKIGTTRYRICEIIEFLGKRQFFFHKQSEVPSHRQKDKGTKRETFNKDGHTGDEPRDPGDFGKERVFRDTGRAWKQPR
jgi:hypothetical protein